jgi:hypothetical protein
MRRLVSSGCITAVAATLLAPSAADADVVSVYEDRATGTIDGESCDSGPLAFSIPRTR